MSCLLRTEISSRPWHFHFPRAQNIETVILGRFLAGAFGSTASAMVGGTIADIWAPSQCVSPYPRLCAHRTQLIYISRLWPWRSHSQTRSSHVRVRGDGPLRPWHWLPYRGLDRAKPAPWLAMDTVDPCNVRIASPSPCAHTLAIPYPRYG